MALPVGFQVAEAFRNLIIAKASYFVMNNRKSKLLYNFIEVHNKAIPELVF